MIILLLLISSHSFAKGLELSTVIESTKLHHPKILEEIQRLQESKELVREATGGFDLNLKSEISDRAKGYYDGSHRDVMLEKNLQFFNTKVYAGHRQSSGEFPIYDGEFKTLDEGETRFGVGFSLLRDRSIDKKRLFLWNSQESFNQAKNSRDRLVSIIEMDAKIVYYNWITKGLIVQVYDGLLSVVNERAQGLITRVKKGDLARIYLAENEQYLLKWRTKRALADQEFFKASLGLSLYYRNAKGIPLIVTKDLLPSEFKIDVSAKDQSIENDLKRAFTNSPDLNIIQSQIIQASNEKKFGESQYIPKLDVKLESSRDMGSGLENLRQEDHKFYLSIEIPIEQNIGRGKAAKAKAKMSKLEMKAQFIKEKMAVNLKTLYNKILTQKEIIKNTMREVELALKLERAEMRKFTNGDSDFFVVNLRQQNTTNAQIELIKSKFDLMQTNATYDAIARGIFIYK